MNILFVALAPNDASGGVRKKIDWQVQALRKLGHYVVRIVYKDGVFLAENGAKTSILLKAGIGEINIYVGQERAVCRYIDTANILFEMAYFRHTFCTPLHLHTLRKLRKKGISTVEEIPTYPYDAEFKLFGNPIYQVAAQLDRFFRNGYKSSLDFFITYSDDEFIFDVNTIRIENGVNLNAIEWVDRKYISKKTIRLVTVSGMSTWHGYERLILGLANYQMSWTKDAPIVMVDMIGHGPCEKEWQGLAEKHDLSSIIVFHGILHDKDLDKILRRADIGVASLGWYKKGLTHGSELKIREYMARGLPFIYSADEHAFSSSNCFCKQVPNQDTPLNIDDVIVFYNELCLCTDVSYFLRQFAWRNFSWELWMRHIVETVQTRRKEG